MNPLIKGIHHAGLKPSPAKYDAAVAFYTELLKFDLVRSWVKEGVRGSMIDTGCGLMEIIETAGQAPSGTDCLEHLAFGVTDVDALVETVRAAGYEILVEPKDLVLPSEPPYPIRVAFCRGAAGEKLEFFCVR